MVDDEQKIVRGTEARRIAMRIAYDGTDFVGWQRQAIGRSVQGELERILSRLGGEQPVTVVGAGRTDSGVHAHGQVAHAEIASRYSSAELHHAICRMAPTDIAILELVDAPPDFHARFHATSRSYRYSIHSLPDPFRARCSWYFSRTLDTGLLSQAACEIIGEHDFTSLSKHNPDTPNMFCRIIRSYWAESKFGVEYHVTADRFLYGMVRLIVGLQVDIAIGRRSVEEIPLLLSACDRSVQSQSAPARGLSLMEVSYPAPIFRETTSNGKPIG